MMKISFKILWIQMTNHNIEEQFIKKQSNSNTIIDSSSEARILQEILKYKIIRHCKMTCTQFYMSHTWYFTTNWKIHLARNDAESHHTKFCQKEYLSSLETAFVKNDIPRAFFGLFVEESLTFFDLSSCSFFGDFDFFSKKCDLFSNFMFI